MRFSTTACNESTVLSNSPTQLGGVGCQCIKVCELGLQVVDKEKQVKRIMNMLQPVQCVCYSGLSGDLLVGVHQRLEHIPADSYQYFTPAQMQVLLNQQLPLEAQVQTSEQQSIQQERLLALESGLLISMYDLRLFPAAGAQALQAEGAAGAQQRPALVAATGGSHLTGAAAGTAGSGSLTGSPAIGSGRHRQASVYAPAVTEMSQQGGPLSDTSSQDEAATSAEAPGCGLELSSTSESEPLTNTDIAAVAAGTPATEGPDPGTAEKEPGSVTPRRAAQTALELAAAAKHMQREVTMDFNKAHAAANLRRAASQSSAQLSRLRSAGQKLVVLHRLSGAFSGSMSANAAGLLPQNALPLTGAAAAQSGQQSKLRSTLTKGKSVAFAEAGAAVVEGEDTDGGLVQGAASLTPSAGDEASLQLRPGSAKMPSWLQDYLKANLPRR